MRLLLVEDEVKLAEVLKIGLTKKGYAVDIMHDGEKAFNRIALNHMDYDLVILDLMLPGKDGASITKEMRAVDIITPVLILTAKSEVESKIDLLLSGADDYMVKPFSFDELCARIQALLRRPIEMISTILSFSDIELNPSDRTVTKNETLLPLTLKEYVILEYFMRNPGKVINREELLSHLWDFNYSSFSNVVDVHIKNLRKKLDRYGNKNLLQTVRGVGYQLKE